MELLHIKNIYENDQMIISASRRTDIPAFYSEWFINRIREEYLYVRNPFNHNLVKKISLKQEDVDAIVFWTRNPEKLITHLDYLDHKSFRYYFQYTITGYSRTLELNTPHPSKAIKTFQVLSSRIGKDKVIWRFDPIIFSNITDEKELLRLFNKIATSLNGYTNKVIISFYDNYKKVETNLKKIPNFIPCKPSDFELNSFVDSLINIANENDMVVETCSENLQELNLHNNSLHEGKCIDDKIINQIFGTQLNFSKDTNQRKECGCVQSIDIGTYNTCLHGCTYCYATSNRKSALHSNLLHDSSSPFLITSPKDEVYIKKNLTLF